MLAFFLAQSANPSPVGPIALLVAVIAVIVVGFWYRARQDKKGSPVTAHTTVPAAAVQAPGKTVAAPGSFGEIQLRDVDDKSAAMLIAIVADELKTPLNQLRFLSIRQLKEGK